MAAPMTERAIARIRQLIIDGELRPGSRLPPEQELAALVGSSRNTTREAVRALVTARVLDVRRGDGTFVTSLRPELLLDSIGMALDLISDESHLELLAVRRVLESAAAELAARRIGAAGLAELARLLDLLRDSVGDDENYRKHDAAFHAVISRHCGNATLTALLGSLSRRTVRVDPPRGVADIAAQREGVGQLQVLLEALGSGDAALAAAAATVHVAAAEAAARKVLAETGRSTR